MRNEFKEWSDVTFECSKEKLTVDVWGRRYIFDKSFLPSGVEVLGKEILALPSKITPQFGETEGTWDKFAYFVYEKSDEEVVVLASATSGNIILNTAMTFYFDGFIKIDLKVVPYWEFAGGNFYSMTKGVGANYPCLTGLSMDFYIKNEMSNLFHFWPNTHTSIANLPVVSSGATVPRSFPFKPYLWTGNEDCGISICCESDKGLQLSDKEKYADITTGDEYTNIHIHILDYMPKDWQGRHDLWVDTLTPLCYTFGIQATPVKPMPDNVDDLNRKYHIYRMKTSEGDYIPDEVYDIAKKAAEAGVKYIVPHADWCTFQNHGRAEDEEKLKDFIEKCHSWGMKVLLYFGYEYSTLLPDWNKNADKFLAKNLDGHYVGGWQRNYEYMQRDFLSCSASEYSDEMIRQVVFTMEEYGADGIYADGTYIPWECANENHGCGYRDEHGKLHITYPIFAVREHVKKLYAEVCKRGGTIDTHQSGCCVMPTLAFSHSYFDSENIQVELEKEGMEFLDFASFRAEYIGKNHGLPLLFMANTNENFTMEKILPMTILHNVYAGPRELENLVLMKKVWSISDKYALSKARFHAYWEKDTNLFNILSEGKIMRSYYETDKEYIVVVSCFERGAKEVKIELPYDADIEILVYEDKKMFEDGNILTLELPYSEFNMIRIEKK